MNLKSPFLLIICFFFLFSATAQDSPKIKLGVQVGYDLAGMRSNYTNETKSDFKYEYSNISTFNINTYFRLKGEGKFSISSELGYIVKGSEVSLEKYPNFPKYKYKLQYLTLPILANFNIVDKLSLGLGLDISFLIKGEFAQFDLTENYNKIDLSAIAGIDFTIVEFLDIAVRYGYGFLPVESIVLTDNTGNAIGEEKLFNQYFQISLRYNFLRK